MLKKISILAILAFLHYTNQSKNKQGSIADNYQALFVKSLALKENIDHDLSDRYKQRNNLDGELNTILPV